MLLRKVWESLSGISSSSNSNTSNNSRIWQSTTSTCNFGSFDRLPEDVVGLILRKLGPNDAAKLCVVCKTWRQIVVSDNRLWIQFFQSNFVWDWDSIFFSETQLCYDHQLSLMQIYGYRVKVPGAIIVDGGSGYCKFGWSKYPRPSGRSATFLVNPSSSSSETSCCNYCFLILVFVCRNLVISKLRCTLDSVIFTPPFTPGTT